MKHYYLFFVLLCIVSCLPDDVLGPDPLGDDTSLIDDITFQQNFGDAVNVDFIGTVRNAENQIVSGAQVQIGANTAFTDHNGVFVLNNVSVFERFAYVKVSKEGYLLGTRTIVPSTSSSNHIAITLLEKNVVATIESSEETTVTFNDSKVTFGGAFIDSSGNPYEGQVEVSMHYLAPNVASTYQQMPGALFAQDEGNNAVSLETYGMLAVDLFSPGGEPLNIAEETPATIEFPVDVSQNGIAPTTINLWSFDEAVGYWREEGEATKVGNSYVAEVTHFSWWNCDLPLDYITACISLETTQGALANNYFEIIRNQTEQTIFAGSTSTTGETCGYFPQDENVTIYVYGVGDCQDEIIYEEELGPYANDTSITITLSDNLVQQTTLTATLIKCDGEPITEGYVYIFNESSNNFFDDTAIIEITNGQLNYSLTYCEANNYSLIAFDLASAQNSGLIEFSLEPVETVLDPITSCTSNGGIFEGDVTLSTQEEVDSFGSLGYTEIFGNLMIGGESFNTSPGEMSNISDLSNLSSLTKVSEDVFIFDSGLLQNLNGLDNLEMLKSLYLLNNQGLENLDGLQNLIEVDILFIKGLSITNLNELQNTTIKSGLALWDLPFLEDITALNLDEEQEIGIQLTDCSSILDSDLTNLFSSISSSGFIHISLMDINSISFLSEINIDELRLEDNSNLSSLNGLENFTNFERLSIINSPLISSLQPLSNLAIVNDRLEIRNMQNLTSLQGLNSLVSAGSLALIGNQNLVSLQSLISLNSLDRLEITNNSQLQSLEIFSSLNSLNWLEINSNDNISTLEGLHNLNDVNLIKITYNDQLESISALGNITNVNSVSITDNPNLQSLNGLDQISTINGILFITLNNIQSLEGLNQLNYVSTLRIAGNQNLQSLEGLNSLTYTNNIEIWNNQNLINLNGLEQLNYSNSILIGGEATNGGNQSLTDFCALQNLFINGAYSEVDFINNAYNPTVQDIIDGNCSQ